MKRRNVPRPADWRKMAETVPNNRGVAMKFRKKPVVIEAFPVRAALDYAANDWKKLPMWLADSYEAGNILFAKDHVQIQTLEGDHRGDLDDMIIQGVKGELYPCKPDIFSATYEPAE